ncbi:angiotensin ii [Dermatophagoides farinae]|uniref:Angiotensin ii n=1 Tax=Dermatophagoides farinae TaxID=6954 RepID=A0A9D4SEN4_DERFA|nr:angiotensin ii [Dermatophagoides farinae]
MDTFDNQVQSFSRSLNRLFLPIIMDPFNSFQRSPIKGTFFYISYCSHGYSMLTVNWLPEICFLYNLLFFLTLLWALESKENPEPIQFAAIINLLAILFDIIAMSTNFNHNHYREGFGFSIFLLICNILVRPFTTFVLLRIYSDRDIRQTLYGGGTTTTSGSGIHNPNHDQFNVFGNRTGYQDLDSQPQQSNGPSSTATTTAASAIVNMPYQSVPEPISQQQLIDTTPNK